jgi:hypothetical protein
MPKLTARFTPISIRRKVEWRRKIRQQHEDMFVRMLGKRDVIGTKPDDPERLMAILEEWFGR